MGEKLGGDAARTVDPSGPKRYLTLYDVMLSHESWGSARKGDIQSYGVCLPKALVSLGSS